MLTVFENGGAGVSGPEKGSAVTGVVQADPPKTGKDDCQGGGDAETVYGGPADAPAGANVLRVPGHGWRIRS